MQHIISAKELIAKSFLELSELKSVDKITVKDIAANCGITKTTFYNHFCDKYDLMMWIYMEPVKNIVFRIHDEGYSLRRAISDNLHYLADNRNYLINALKNTLGHDSFINRASEINFTLLRDFIKSSHGIYTLSVRTETMIKLYACGTVCLECGWLINNMPIPIETLADILEAGLPEELKPYIYESPKRKAA
ncbi:MAG: TetR/AcrR family transcriptional regulator C-terminal domain-containing protein [Synergistaceae bacterium]|nr:TetR/AcrR family transcriptional regulator C-terminal domain-containing protein [Synergistaceae bacterium]